MSAPAEKPRPPIRPPARIAGFDLHHALTVALFVSVFAFAATVAYTFGLLAGAAGLLVPFAIWYTAYTRHVAVEETRRRMDAALERKETRLMTRPAPLRTPLDQGGQAPAAPWSAAGQGYGGDE